MPPHADKDKVKNEIAPKRPNNFNLTPSSRRLVSPPMSDQATPGLTFDVELELDCLIIDVESGQSHISACDLDVYSLRGLTTRLLRNVPRRSIARGSFSDVHPPEREGMHADTANLLSVRQGCRATKLLRLAHPPWRGSA